MKRRIVAWVCAALLAALPSAALAASGKSASRAPRPDTARVRIGSAESATTAFVAWPAGEGPAPSIIVVHEWWGLNGQIREVARRLAGQGYVAVVPDLYHGKVADDAERAHELSRGVDDDAALADLAHAAVWLRAQARTKRSPVGVVGFCMGGRLAQLVALRSADVAAAVMFYGPPETDPGRLATLAVPLQAHFGAEDDGIPMDEVGALKAGLQSAGKEGEVFVYPGAGHAFANEARPSYHGDAARQAWARTLAFLQKHLKT